MTTKQVEKELEELERRASKRTLRIQRWQSLRMMLKEVIETIAFILMIFFILRGMMQNYKIEGSSMEPSMHDGQYIWVNKLAYFHVDLNAPLRWLPGKSQLPPKLIYPFQKPQRGDVLVFIKPDSNERLIKRIIGLPGDHVKVEAGKVFVNEVEIEELYLNSQTPCIGSAANCDMDVPVGTVYVVGDNRPNSSDSRSWGPLPLDHIIGKAWLSYWPQEYWGLIDTPTYAIDNGKFEDD